MRRTRMIHHRTHMMHHSPQMTDNMHGGIVRVVGVIFSRGFLIRYQSHA